MLSLWRSNLLHALTLLPWISAAQHNYSSTIPNALSYSIYDDRDGCPPCFNCNLEQFQCLQYGDCRKASGRCSCPPGFGGEDCSAPLCGSLAEGYNRAPRSKDEQTCNCADGWEGINCNVCKTNDACNALMPESIDGVCFREGIVQKENYQMCDITNKKILDMLKGRKPQATFSCNKEEETCSFQFWVDEVESFYCGLDTCSSTFDAQHDRNTTKYKCKNINCNCIQDRFLCGENGSVDISEYLTQLIKGPASFSSISTEKGGAEDGSVFSEPGMNQLIADVFGDSSIFLDCHSGECLYKTEVPGYARPVKKINTPLIAGVIAGCALFVVAVILLVWILSSRSGMNRFGPIHLSDDDEEAEQLMADHKPAALHFENVSYEINGKQILSNVKGAVHPGEIMAIMGASGAGKTTFLDILARKRKKGVSRGNFYINGESVRDDEFRNAIGFVDQEDAMLPTLTVHETILDSALLRLPREMSWAVKQQRVEDIEKQLGIYHIRNQLIGSEEGNRGISGGEKRRVGIACELVTSPSILFLDEPTSGLDAYNAYNVVECLVNLVKTYNRTVVFTIHQPRSNIVALFDQLVLLAKGRTVYSGPFASCQAYFDSIGYSCPPGFNIADYVVDLTMHAVMARSPMDLIIEAQRGTATRASSAVAIKSIPSAANIRAESTPNYGSPNNDQARRPRGNRRTSIRQQQENALFTRKKNRGGESPPATPRSDGEESLLDNSRDASQAWLRLSRQQGNPPPQILEVPHETPTEHGSDLQLLIDSYNTSDVSALVTEDLGRIVASADAANGHTNGNSSTNGNASKGRMKGYRKASFPRQIIILSTRTWRNLYRNPMLMLTHYAIAILLAVLLGALFYGLSDDIAGFQNRLGLFFFILALWGFSTLTSLTVFATERLLFVRERAKGYYMPISYFSAKVFFDIVPLRLIPPIILGVIVYPMTGLVPTGPQFFIFMLFLVLFNLAAAAICLFLGVVFKNGGVANLIGSLFMLGSLLFSGFLLNHETIPKYARWLQTISIFHYGFEGLIVNEVKKLSLKDHKYGLDIEVPGAAILSSFGFNTQALWMDVVGLAVFGGVFIVLAYAAMHVLLVERR